MSENTITLSADDKTAAALVATIKSAVNGVGKYAAYVEAHAVTRETVKDHALALAVLAYPNDEPVQTKRDGDKKIRTRFGNAVSAAAMGLKSALPEDDAPKKVALRVSLSGEGGGTVVIPTDHALYDTLVALVAENNA